MVELKNAFLYFWKIKKKKTKRQCLATGGKNALEEEPQEGGRRGAGQIQIISHD